MIQAGIRVLFEDCLQVTSDDHVLVLYDEAFRAFLPQIVDYLAVHQYRATFTEIPKRYQHALISWALDVHQPAEVPLGVSTAIAESTVVLSCLDGDLETGRLRRAILQQQRQHGSRLAHMPGLSSEILDLLTRSPTFEILKYTELVAWALGEAQQAVLLTYDSAGRTYRLDLRLGGWDNEPLMSPGVIFPNSWGNIPPGEAFCCPDERAVHGDVCISGSFPGKVLESGGEAILRFEEGALASWGPPASPLTRFLEGEAEEARGRGDGNWRVLAELGVGLNPAVKELTGNPLFDEKAYGTVHVAIGDNTIFGRHVKADKHADMVILRPTLMLDDVTAMTKGELHFDHLAQWRTEAQHRPIPLDKRTPLFINRSRVDNDSQLCFRRLSSGGRLGYVRMSWPIGNTVLSEIVSQLNEIRPTSYSELKCTGSGTDIKNAVSTLHHYRVLEIGR